MREASTFDEVVATVMADGHPNSSSVKGMRLDLDNALRQIAEVDERSVRVERTAKPERLLEASCRARSGSAVHDVAEQVRARWLSDVAYDHLEAHDLRLGIDRASFELITQAEPSGAYVTGIVEILSADPTTSDEGGR